MKYEQVWDAVDKLAKSRGFSPSGLAKKAGLDATTFNKSKRIRPDGKKRWPSLDSINKILDVCGIDFEEFYKLGLPYQPAEISNSIPFNKFSAITAQNVVLQDVITDSWKTIPFPETRNNVFALEIDTFNFEPFYHQGKMIVLSQHSEIRHNDRIMLIRNQGQPIILEFVQRTGNSIEGIDFIHGDREISIPLKEITVINRILWAAQ